MKMVKLLLTQVKIRYFLKKKKLHLCSGYIKKILNRKKYKSRKEFVYRLTYYHRRDIDLDQPGENSSTES